jgi:hypothetical protein
MRKCASSGEKMILRFGTTGARGIARLTITTTLAQEIAFVVLEKRHIWTSRVQEDGKRWHQGRFRHDFYQVETRYSMST